MAVIAETPVALTVYVHEAKTQLSRLLEAASRGEEVNVARNGEPVARLVPLPPTRRVPGAARCHLSAEHFEPLPPDGSDAFEGER